MAKYVPPHARGAAAAAAATPAAPRESWAEAQRRMDTRRAPSVAAPAEPATELPAEPPKSHLDWLREQQSRYVHRTRSPAELAAEMATMTFEQLRQLAGPPPTVSADEFQWSSDGVWCDTHDAGRSSFDYNLRSFRRGECLPPDPLPSNQRDCDGSNSRVNAYCNWHARWGPALERAWIKEHPHLQKPAAKPKPSKSTKPVEERRESWRVVDETVSAQSGW
jgi:hypothetical protein